MFEISNITTYKGLMVQGKKDMLSNLLQSQWIDVNSHEAHGHWIPEEGKASTKAS